MAQEEERNNLNRINTEPITKELVTELLNSGYNMDQIKAVAQDDATLKQITMAYSEAASEGMQKSAEAFGTTIGGLFSYDNDSRAQELSSKTGKNWKYSDGIYVSDDGETKTQTQVDFENLFGGINKNVISPFLKGAEEGLNK